MSTLVSIILNCYNGAEFLKETLESIKVQTFSDYEIIFVDNCSVDSSAEIAQQFDNRLKYFKTDKHVKLGEARNVALSKCSGEYIAFIDADDLWKQQKL